MAFLIASIASALFPADDKTIEFHILPSAKLPSSSKDFFNSRIASSISLFHINAQPKHAWPNGNKLSISIAFLANVIAGKIVSSFELLIPIIN